MTAPEYYKNRLLENLTEEFEGVAYTEEWRCMIGFNGYEVSSFGRVRAQQRQIKYSNGRIHIHKAAILKPFMSRRGYLRVTLFKDKVRVKTMVHLAVGLAFISNPDKKPTINHKFGIKHDNRSRNLEWSNHVEQNIHAYKKLGRHSSTGLARPVYQFDLNRLFLKEFPSYAQAERAVGVCKTSIIDCVNGRAKTAGGFIWDNKI